MNGIVVQVLIYIKVFVVFWVKVESQIEVLKMEAQDWREKLIKLV
jgi:hypothetical protein